jgi:hypothetical protein
LEIGAPVAFRFVRCLGVVRAFREALMILHYWLAARQFPILQIFEAFTSNFSGKLRLGLGLRFLTTFWLDKLELNLVC